MIGSQIKCTIRMERGHTLANVAKGTKISKSFLALVEAGKSDITITRSNAPHPVLDGIHIARHYFRDFTGG